MLRPAPHLGIPRSALRIPHFFWSVNAKQLEQPGFQPDPSRPAPPQLRATAGASPATDANCSQGVISSARRFAKPEVRGASPRESTSLMVIMM
jgi:hypothetical protein